LQFQSLSAGSYRTQRELGPNLDPKLHKPRKPADNAASEIEQGGRMDTAQIAERDFLRACHALSPLRRNICRAVNCASGMTVKVEPDNH